MRAVRLGPFRPSVVSGFGAAIAVGLGWLALNDLTAPPLRDAQLASTEAKLSDRLSFVDEDEPVRRARIFDTLAMFSRPSLESSPWSERRVPTLASLDPGPLSMRSRPTMPRMVAAERAQARPQTAPPHRPVELAAASVQQGSVPAAAEPPREPLSVLGWTVPGSQHLPTRRDAASTAALIGDKAKRIGTGTATMVSDAASAVGDSVAAVGSAVAETVGWR